MTNRLGRESSPYLRQHKDNPVDWYPWGEEAFSRARAEDKPVFVSIGYAACHWCHVMAHESFEDEVTAALMNELFINVKIDREERPDVDSIYMTAIQIMGQGGGGPLSAWCTPDGKPYFLGTYFPPADRYGRPGFPRILRAMSEVYRDRRAEVVHNTEGIMEGLRHIDEQVRRGAQRADVSRLDESVLIKSGRSLVQSSDAEHGGFGSRPKFPSSSAHALLARAGRLSFGEPAAAAFLRQARAMARGGIYDHVGGGFSRYSVDERWLVPHFEKMLYDNAQLLAIFADAHAMSGDEWPAETIRETAGWLEREMLHEAGGLFASLDADSEGAEGKSYVWRPEEVQDALGVADAATFCAAYGVSESGNFEDTGASVLSRITERGSPGEEDALRTMREALLAVRAGRVRPGTDDKVLSGWNGLAVTGLLRAWGATGWEPARELAETVAGFLAETMCHEGGARLWRVWSEGSVKLDGTLADYAMCARAFFDMAEATGDAVWWQRGETLLASAVDRFYEERGAVGVFYMTPADDDGLLIHRPESHHDGAIPSGAAVCVECLLRVGHVAGDADSLRLAERYLAGRVEQAAGQPFGAAQLLGALDLYLHPVVLVVSDGRGADALRSAARRAYSPTLMIAGPWAAEELRADKEAAADGAAQAYVCRGQTCSAPVVDEASLRALLESSDS